MSINAFTDLPGLTKENIAELSAIGIESVQDLREALKDEKRVKEIIKNLSGVGPKTAESWKALVEGSAPAVEIVESDDEVESSGYRVKIKPVLDDDTAEGLAKRAIISGRRPAFKRQEWFRYSKLGEKWRRPKGIHSKMKRQLKRRPPTVDIGFRGPASVRGLHPSGFEEVMVYNVEGLEGLDPKTQAARIGGTVGTRKKMAIENRADALGIRVLNRLV